MSKKILTITNLTVASIQIHGITLPAQKTVEVAIPDFRFLVELNKVYKGKVIIHKKVTEQEIEVKEDEDLALIGFSEKALAALEKLGINTIEQFNTLSIDDLDAAKGLKKKELEEIQAKLMKDQNEQ